ncbi:uncharacterized protein LOC135633273 [Musa acuminata AAA Group]|uniref:uncharacterized protein LOC135633273 n=1 Tax=Musa acuminata AAA Group TaxID=214697 RepID=UPI0031D08E62
MSGGAMKTAAKAATLCGYRLVSPLAGRASAIARWPFKPVNVTVSAAAPAAEGGPSISVSTSDNGLQDAVPVSAVQRPPLETHDRETKDENFDGWAEYEQGITLDPVQPASRLVFGSIPTLEEAKEATSDLIDAFDKVYPPSHNVPAIEVAHRSAHHEASSIIPSMPRHVVETFSLLQRSPEVQTVVASIASDENVWNSVMKNEKVMEFYKTHLSVVHPEPNVTTEVPVAENDHGSSCAKANKSPAFSDFLHNVKNKVVEIACNISSLLQEHFGNSSGTSSPKTTDGPFAQFPMGASLMTLAITVIMVVLFKRV